MASHHYKVSVDAGSELVRFGTLGCYGPFVDEETFWALVAECRQESGNNSELASRVLFRRLRTLDAAEAAEFVRLWERARSRLSSWSVTDAACLLLGSVEEEDLCQIQDWIISYGRLAVERIIEDPDNLVDLAGDARNARAGWFGEFMTEAHIVVSGTWPLGYNPDEPEDLTGERTDLAGRSACAVGTRRNDIPSWWARTRHHLRMVRGTSGCGLRVPVGGG